MLMTKRKPAGVGEILVQEFMEPMGLTQGVLAKAMGVPRKHVNELCNNRRALTAPTALILARVFGNSPDFWLNVQRRSDLWEAMHSPRERERVHRLPQVAASLYVQPEVRAVTEHTGKDERSRRGKGPAVIAKLVDVLAWHAHGLGQHALSQSHRLHEFLNQDFADASRFPFRHQHRSPQL